MSLKLLLGFLLREKLSYVPTLGWVSTLCGGAAPARGTVVAVTAAGPRAGETTQPFLLLRRRRQSPRHQRSQTSAVY